MVSSITSYLQGVPKPKSLKFIGYRPWNPVVLGETTRTSRYGPLYQFTFSRTRNFRDPFQVFFIRLLHETQKYIKCIKMHSSSGSFHSGSQFCYDELRDYSRKRKHNQQLCEVSCNVSKNKSIIFSPSLADPCRKKNYLRLTCTLLIFVMIVFLAKNCERKTKAIKKAFKN